ncbi:MAG: serine/threonine-protein phosphatase [Acidobacteria bacterium]|nr:serine/threonine-protein phosphatase [Acidobacteriota bacterium]
MTHGLGPDVTPGTFVAHGVTDVGRVRTTNEDTLHVDVAAGIFVVADGMGGHQAGEVASSLAVTTIVDFLTRSRLDEGLTWPFGLDAGLSLEANRLATAVKVANRRVVAAAAEQPERSGMGTTVVAAIAADDRVTYCGVGDSRLYLVRGGVLSQLTRDDTWLAAVLAQNADADPTALEQHPFRHMLTEAIGTVENVTVHVQEHHWQAGDRLMLCSDGLHSMGADDEIARRLAATAAAGPSAACDALVAAALEAGARDNVTVLVIERR